MLVFDKNDMKIKIENIIFEDFLSKKQIQNLKWDDFLFNNILYIPKGYQVSNLLQDGKKEFLNGKIICFISINDFPVIFATSVINECLEKDIFIHTNTYTIPNESFVASPQLYLGQSSNPKQFVDILQNIKFHEQFLNSNEMMMNNIMHDFSLSTSLEGENMLLPSKVNVIHLRLEEDAISSFCKQNKSEFVDFQKKVEERYIELIQKYLHPTDELTIVLSSDYNNNVIDFLTQNNYRFVCTPKIYRYREINAIQDVLFYRFCNHIFIGVYESSFSYTFMYKMFKREKYDTARSVIFNLNNINTPEKIFTKYSSLEDICQFR